jgi:tRNA nucleotidyltransferase (CCA-adding enzyme)
MAVVADLQTIDAREAVTVECEAPDDELLLVDWLNMLVFEMSTRKCLFGRFEVKIAGHHLTATAWGEPVDIAHHQPAVEIKGATYTALRVRQENDQWIAQTVVDV